MNSCLFSGVVSSVAAKKSALARRDLENQNFSAFLAAIFKACRNQTATLVPVLSKAERCSVEDLDFAKSHLQTKLESLCKEHCNWIAVGDSSLVFTPFVKTNPGVADSYFG